MGNGCQRPAACELSGGFDHCEVGRELKEDCSHGSRVFGFFARFLPRMLNSPEHDRPCKSANNGE